MSDAVDKDAAMVDEYGNPIGQLIVNMDGKGPDTALAVADNSVAEAQDAQLADAAADLPGIAPGEIATYYPGYDDVDKRDAARHMVIAEGRGDTLQMAEKLGVPERTILMWIANGHWADARRKAVVARDELSRLDLAETRIRKRNAVFHEQLDQAERIRRKAVAGIEADEVSVKSGAEAWAAAAKTEQTILGLSEAGKVASADGRDDGDGDDGKKAGKTPLVMVFQGGGLPPIRRAP